MRKILVLTIAIFWGAVVEGMDVGADTIPGGWGAFRAAFANPGKDFGSAPLWVWNTKVTDGIIDTMLSDFKAKGFGGVFVHPRAGLVTAYLSDDWFARWKHTVEKAGQLGMNVWIYDENSYPSGFAGGHVPDAMPSSFNQGEMLEMRKDPVRPAGDFMVQVKKGDWYYSFKKTFYYTSPWYGGFSYVDLMVKGVTEAFLHQTMPGYERAVGADFGKTVKGIFSDEPNIEVQYPHSVRWTPDLFATFAQRWGYRLEDQLPSLLEDIGDYKKVRHDYYAVLLQLFIDRWSKPFGAYAERHKLEWTGHYWEHEWPDPNHGPDNMAMYAYPQRPGVDMLFNQYREDRVNGQFGNVRAIKELASVSNQLGKRRNLSETYGGGGWELSYKDMKRLGDWEFVLGVNTLNQHLAFMTIMGSRKYDYPQSFSYHNPWWPHYRYLNDYFTRLTWALTRGREMNKVLVLEPTTTMWMYSAYDGTGPTQRQLGSLFQAYVTRLTKAQIEYDLGCEDVIREHGSVKGGQLIVGERSYGTLVIPPGTENLDKTTYSLLQDFVKGGGKLVNYSKLDRLDGVADAMDMLNAVFNADSAGIDAGLLPEGLDIRMKEGQGLYHMRRTIDGGQLLFFTNAEMEQPAKGTFSIRGKQLLEMNLFDGSVRAVEAEVRDGVIMAAYDLAPAGSVLYFASDRVLMKPAKRSNVDLRDVEAKPVTVKRSDLNTLMIDFCDIRIRRGADGAGDVLLKDKHVYDAADTIYKYFGFSEGNPWNTSVQYKDRTVVREHFQKGSGFVAAYRFRIAEGVSPAGFQAVVEQPGLWKVYVNGQLVEALSGKWWLDKHFGIYAAGKYMHAGENELVVKADPMSVYAEVEPVYIRGDFGLESAEKGWTIVAGRALAVGSWKRQGMPLYGESVLYSKAVEVAKPGGRYLVKLGAWKGTVATVSVNGKYAGVIALDPFVLDIGAFLHAGKNVVTVTVTGSLKNLLGPHHNKPKPGLVSPWHWRQVKRYPRGEEYDTYDYGLMEDFSIMTSR